MGFFRELICGVAEVRLPFSGVGLIEQYAVADLIMLIVCDATHWAIWRA